MQRAPTTIEEQLILKAIAEECPWGNLPKRLQSTLNSKEEWHRRITEHCIKKRLPWNKCFARKVCKEGEYYEELMRYLRRNLALYPYHLAEHVCRVMRVSSFKYYCDMIFEVMKNEQPYDSIPNFSAADALRLTGIGRNEFIDIMNKCRSKKIMWKLNKSIAKELLPIEPVDFIIEPWWGICLVNFTLEEFKKLSEEEMATIDKICKEETNSFILFDPEVVKGLYRRGLVYFDVPVYADDRFKVSRLEGFVSNREQMYEDPIEELLYAVFVVLSENSTVAELAATLQADLSQLTAAASFACRLGWAVKIIDPGSILQEKPNTLLTPRSIIIDEADGSNATMSSANLVSDGNIFPPGDALWTENSSTDADCSHVAFVVDANITSYLMMGSVSPGLKFHAVTLYEAGKLGYGSIADLCRDLITLEGAKFEGELQEFANHAFSLRCILECITSGGIATDDKIGNESKSTRKEQASSSANDVSYGDEPRDSGTNKSELSEDYEQSIIAGDSSTKPQTIIAGDSSTEPHTIIAEDSSTEPHTIIAGDSSTEPQTGSMDDENSTTALSEEFNSNYNDPKLGRIFKIDEKSDSFEGSGEKEVKKLRKYGVDILRCESLAALAPATLDRLFHRDYDIIVSMIPLPYSSVLPGAKGPVHFGPPSHSAMTPWMKLVLYAALSSGPISVVLMKGQCLRLLPAPLAGCEKALIWSWDGSAVGGLGGKLEGDLVKGSVLLHCLNSLLKYSSVLVQPLSKMDLDDDGMVVTLDVPMPLKNSDGSMACIGEELGLSTEECSKLNSLVHDISNKMNLWTVGYVRLIRLFKGKDSEKFPFDDEKYEWVPLSAEFGIPLFSPKLCRSICRRVVSSKLLQSDILNEHQEAMQDLRRKLRDVCAEYQATGPTARLLYNKELTKDINSSRQLMTYASGRWNPLSDPSSPISGASSENQRLKLANRQRSRIEVLSFDGTVLRSYSLSPLHEVAARPAEDAAGVPRGDPDDSDNKEVVLPGVNLLFDGFELCPFEIGACLQARLPVSLIAEASSASTILVAKQQKA